jgi:iron complex outermembrane receptor protein
MKNLIDRYRSSLIATASAVIVATPVKAQAIPITNVEVVNTEAGIVLQLDTPSPKTPQILETRYGNTLAIDIPNTQLQLGESDQFRQNNPVPAIESIEVNQRYANSIRIILIGKEEPPEVSLQTNAEGFALQVSPEVTVTEEPSPAPTETPPSPSTEETQEPIELVVTATRTEEETRKVPRSVTVINREEIEDQATFTSNIGDILGKTVPGFGPPNGLVTTLRQSMRGRDFSVLIDGVPQSTNREFLVDLDTIGPSNIEKIEVVRGPTAVFGADATGGVINIITRQPEEGEFNSSSKIGTTFSLDPLDESVGYNLEQSISGNVEGIDYQLTGSFESTNAFFDAEGDRIARFRLGNGLRERENVNLLGKIGWDINSQERLQFSASYYNTTQDPEFRVPLRANPDEAKALIEPIGDIEIDDPTGGDNLVLSLDYTNEDILGSQVQGQLFYRSLTSRSFPEPTSTFFRVC